jgi:hypothetical protein
MIGLQNGDNVLISYANPDNRNWYISANLSLGPDRQDTRQETDTGTTGAIAFTILGNDDFDLHLIFIKFDSAPASAGNLTVTFDATEGSNYDTSGYVINPVGRTSISIINGKVFLDGVESVGYVNENNMTVIAGYQTATDDNRVSETDPISNHHLEDTPLALTNIATNTTGYAYLDMDGYRYFSIQGETSGTAPTDVLTCTIEATDQDDGTAQESCAFQDHTLELFGVVSWVDTDFFAVCSVPVAFKYVRLKYVTSNDAGNDADLTAYAKRMY